MRSIILLSFALFNLHAIAFCQQYQIRNYSTDNILSHSTIYRIFQDRNGIMWFCTDISATSFDGISFKDQISINDGLINTSPMSISEDDNGTKLITTLNQGIVILDDTGASLYKLENGRYPKHEFYSVAYKNRIWLVGKDSSQYLYEIRDHRIERVNITNDRGENVTFNKIKRWGNEVIAAGSDGLYKIDDTIVRPFLHDLVKEEVIDIRKSKSGKYVLGLKHRVVVSDGQSVLDAYDIGETNTVGNILYDSHDNIWVCIYGKTVLMITDKKITDIRSRLNIPNMTINDIFEDNEGNIWFATYNDGIFMIGSLNIFSYPLREQNTTSPCHRISPLDSNTLLLASFGKVNKFVKGQIESFNVQSLLPDEFVYFAKKIGDAIYIGTPNKLIKKNIDYPYTETNIILERNEGAVSICMDSKSRLWVGSYRSAFRIKNDKIIEKITDTALLTKRINDIIEDKNGNIWFATQRDLVKYNGNTFECITPDPADEIKFFLYLLEDDHNRIWAIARSKLVYLTQNNKFNIITKKDGMSSTLCVSFAKDKQNRLWVCTRNGLNYIDLNTLKASSYSEGIVNKEVLAVYCSPGNNVFIGTNDRLLSLNVGNISYNASPPPVLIRCVKTPTSTVYLPKQASLPYVGNKIVIDFIGLNYRDPSDIEYRYKVQNLDNTWHTTSNNSIELASIPPGEYTFVLNARKRRGRWSHDVKLPITVSTPVWKTWWFITGSFLIASTIIYVTSRKQTQKIESKKRQQLLLLNKIAYFKQQALAALINPHFIFNCMNSIQHFLNKKDHDKANSYLADFAALIRMTIEDAQEAFIPLTKEITRLELYLSLEQLRFGDDLQYSIYVADDVALQNIRIPNMIIQPYVENAIWHGIMPKEGIGNIYISFTLVDNNKELKVEVRDDGIGMKQSATKKKGSQTIHLGNRLTEERLKLLRQITGQLYAIRISDLADIETTAGTLVEIYIPVSPITPDA